MKIHQEPNYRAFKILKGNRPLVPGKVKRIIDSVKEGMSLFQYCPIMVNSQMYVIDGQHRLEACKKLNLMVYYVVVPDITLVQIAKLNSNTSRWKSSDFFNCFIQTGNKDYEVLQKFQQKYELSINMAVSLLMTGQPATGGRPSETFTEGKFRVIHFDKAEALMKKVMSYHPMVDDNKIVSNRNFIMAVQRLLASKSYSHQEVIDKLTRIKAKITEQPNYKEYIYAIEKLFNKDNSKRRILYHVEEKGKNV